MSIFIPCSSSQVLQKLGVVVEKRSRKRGIGERLLKYGEEWARAQGCLKVILRSNILRREAHEFYQGWGIEKLNSRSFSARIFK